MYYFNQTSMRPCPIQGEIMLEKHHHFRFGIHKDVDGKEWHFNGFMDGCALAAPVSEMHPYYFSTTAYGNHGLVSQSWKPYKIKIANNHLQSTGANGRACE